MPPLPALTGARFLAATWVVAYHYLSPWFAARGDGGAWCRLVSAGFVGVNFFFLLSGFVLAYSSQGRSFREASTCKAFFWARVGRIYPLYVLSLLPALGVMFMDFVREPARGALPMQIIEEGALTFPMVQAWHPATALLWNYPAWSLSNEAFFYLVFPLIFTAISSWRGRLALILCAGTFVLLFFFFLFGRSIGFDMAQLDRWMYFPLLHLVTFLEGCLLGQAFSGDICYCLSRRHGVWTDLVAGLGLAFIWVLLTSSRRVFSSFELQMGALAPLFGLVILLLATGRGWLAKMVGSRMFSSLGNASYAMYLMQFPVFRGIRKWLQSVGELHLASNLPTILLSFVLLVLLSLGLHRWFELPMRQWIQRRFA